MAKRGKSGKRTNSTNTTANTTAPARTAAAPDPMEQRVVAFAEQLGRIVGTVQAKTEGWMDREALSRQVTSVRDGAAELLEQLKTTVTNATGTAEPAATQKAPAKAKSMGRSGGVVDAPGKKHRKPMPRDQRAMAADSKPARLRAGETNKTVRKLRAGRG
jgi:hypothetical protein